jgi:alginate O-acetyltransferase complex protein AlgI
MLFNSLEFILVFLPLVWGAFFITARRGGSLSLYVLCAASLAFYAWWDYRYVWLLLGSIGFNFCCGLVIARQRIGRVTVGKKHGLIVGLAVNLSVLAYFKYANVFLHSLHDLTGIHVPLLPVLLPLGISFFTFTQIAFLVDVYRGFATEYRFLRYALFVTYLPHLIAGPILHHKAMMPQFARISGNSVPPEMIAMGLSMFALGLGKKVLIADEIAAVGSPMFALARVGDLSFFEAWFGAVAYTLQVYFDFSGYCDMAIGISLLFGIKLPINFDSPYKARNISDFWRRWHITLSRFLRDYLYIPLGGNRCGELRRYGNLLAMMLLAGLWHGAAWTFVVWGGLHGAYLAINHAWRALPVAHRIAGNRAWSIASWILTFVCVVVAWVFFRADNLEVACRMLAAMVGGGRGIVLPNGVRELVPGFSELVNGLRESGLPISWGSIYGLQQATLLIPPFLLLALFSPNTQQLFGPTRVALVENAAEDRGSRPSSASQWQPTFVWAIGCAALALVVITSLHRASEFLYYQF